MKKGILFFVVLICFVGLFAEPTGIGKFPVKARLETRTYSWSYETGDWATLPKIRFYEQFFDKKGRMTKSVEYYDEKNIYRSIVYDYTGRIVPSEKWTGADGKSAGSVEVEYIGGHGVLTTYNMSGKVVYVTVLEKVVDGLVKRAVRRDGNGKLVWVIDYVYDNYGDVISKTMRNPDGNAVFILKYEYSRDKYNNWITRKENMSLYGVNNWPKEIVYRSLEY